MGDPNIPVFGKNWNILERVREVAKAHSSHIWPKAKCVLFMTKKDVFLGPASGPRFYG